MKQDNQNGTKRVNVSVNVGLILIIKNNVGVKINADVNARNWLIKGCVIKDLFGILVIVSECNTACDIGEYLNCWRSEGS